MSNAVLVARGVGRRFGPLVALRGADLDLEPGRVSAVVGENGAGKSTLAKIMAGVLMPDEGTLLLNGRRAVFRRRIDAVRAGVGFVPQSLSFVGALSVVDNHLLGQDGITLDRDKAKHSLAAAASELDVEIVLDRPIERLSLAERQLGELASAIAHGARVLLLDEPTSTLGPMEVERLIKALRLLAARGVAIGLVTHRVREVLHGADHVTVLRAGQMVFAGRTDGLSADEVARLMVGTRSHALPGHKQTPASETIRLQVEGVAVEGSGVALLDDVSFTVSSGEIVGVAGVAGPAQPALAEAIAGLRAVRRGRILVDGFDVTGDAAAADRRKLAYIPEDRTLGLVSNLSVATNASLLRLAEVCSRYTGLRNRTAQGELAKQVIERFDVKPPNPRLSAGRLSSGNQQKLLVGRELDRNPAVIIAHGPTQGLDLAAAAAIRSAMVEAAVGGAAVVLISADLDEILELSHRVVVLAGASISGRFDLIAEPVDIGRLGEAMAGAALREAA